MLLQRFSLVKTVLLDVGGIVLNSFLYGTALKQLRPHIVLNQLFLNERRKSIATAPFAILKTQTVGMIMTE